MNSVVSTQQIDERIREAFSSGEGKESEGELKIDYRVLRAEFFCRAEGNEQACLRYQSGRFGCAFNGDRGTCLSGVN